VRGTAPLARRGPQHRLGFLGTDLPPDSSKGVRVPPYLRDTEGTRTELAELQGAVRHMDAEMGRILAALADLNLESQTLVIFTTDTASPCRAPSVRCTSPGFRRPSYFDSRPAGVAGRHPPQGHGFEYRLPSDDPRRRRSAGAPERAREVLGAAAGRARITLPGTRYSAKLTYHEYYDPRRSVRTESHKLIVNFSTAPAFMDPSQSWRPRSDTVVPPNRAFAYHTCTEL